MTERVAIAPPMGWYPDPVMPAPRQERWWSGSAWSKHTWRPGWLERRLPSVVPPAYRRSLRVGANVVLRPAVALQAVVIALLLASPFAWYLAGAGDAGRQAYIVAVGIQFGTLAAATTLGVIGAVLSRRLGGLGAALWSVGFSLLLFGLAIIAASIMFGAISALA